MKTLPLQQVQLIKVAKVVWLDAVCASAELQVACGSRC